MNATAAQQLRRNVDNQNLQNPTKTYSVPSSTNEDGTLNIPVQAVFLIDPNKEPIPMYGEVLPPGPLLTQQSNAAAIGLGMCITPVGRGRLVESLVCDITCTATVGNRTFFASVIDSQGNAIWRGALSTAVTAGQICGYDIGFGNVGAPSTVVRTRLGAVTPVNVMVRENCPIHTFENGSVINTTPMNLVIQDSANVDGADSMLYRVVYREYQGV